MSRIARIVGQHGAYLAAVATSYGQLGVGLVVQLLMVPLYLSHLGDYRFGVLMMLLGFVNFAAFGVVWLSGSMQRLLGESFARGDETVFADAYAVSKWLYLGYAAAVAVVAGGGLIMLAGPVFRVPPEHHASVVGGILGAAIHFLLLYVLSIDRVALAARGRQAAANLLTIVTQLGFAVLAVPVLMMGGDLLELMLCLAAGSLAAIVLGRLHLRRLGLALTARVRPSAVHRALVGRLAGRTGAAYMAYGVLALLLQADVIIVGLLGGPEVVAGFVLVWRIAELAIVALWRLPEAQMPFLIHRDARGEAGSLRAGYLRALGLMALACGAAALAYGLAGPWLVALWVGPDKAPADPVAYWLAGGAILWLGVARVPAVFAYATVRLRMQTALMAVEFAAKLALTVALLPRFGAVAPLLAINLCHGLGLAVAYPLAAWRDLDRGPA